jgi:hypothetical protein
MTTPPPATRKEFWDRALDLYKSTNGKFTVEQIYQNIGISHEKIEKINEIMESNASCDDMDAYESAKDTIQIWTGLIINQMHIEEGRVPSSDFNGIPDKNRIEDLRNLLHNSIEISPSDINNRGLVNTIHRKYLALMGACLLVQHGDKK